MSGRFLVRFLVRLPCSLALLAALAAAARAEPITIAIVPSVPAGSTLIAEEKGYFREAGLDVKIERIDSMGKAVAFLAANHVQVAQGGINAGIFNSIAQGLPVTLALDGGVRARRDACARRPRPQGRRGQAPRLFADGDRARQRCARRRARGGAVYRDHRRA